MLLGFDLAPAIPAPVDAHVASEVMPFSPHHVGNVRAILIIVRADPDADPPFLVRLEPHGHCRVANDQIEVARDRPRAICPDVSGRHAVMGQSKLGVEIDGRTDGIAHVPRAFRQRIERGGLEPGVAQGGHGRLVPQAVLCVALEHPAGP